MLLSAESCSILTINMHKGLFSLKDCNWCTFCFRNLSKGNRKFIEIQLDNILISGKNDEEHLETLETVLKIISNNGLKLKLKKCMFMQPKVAWNLPVAGKS